MGALTTKSGLLTLLDSIQATISTCAVLTDGTSTCEVLTNEDNDTVFIENDISNVIDLNINMNDNNDDINMMTNNTLHDLKK